MLSTIFKVFPGFCLNSALIKFGVDISADDPWSTQVARDDLVTLSWEFPLYFFLVLFFDYLGNTPRAYFKLSSIFGAEKDVRIFQNFEDFDVSQEREDILSGKRDNDAIIVRGLRKVFDGKHAALKNIYFSIPKGQCFGFLGLNGAGRTTVIMLILKFSQITDRLSFRP